MTAGSPLDLLVMFESPRPLALGLYQHCHSPVRAQFSLAAQISSLAHVRVQ